MQTREPKRRISVYVPCDVTKHVSIRPRFIVIINFPFTCFSIIIEGKLGNK